MLRRITAPHRPQIEVLVSSQSHGLLPCVGEKVDREKYRHVLALWDLKER